MAGHHRHPLLLLLMSTQLIAACGTSPFYHGGTWLAPGRIREGGALGRGDRVALVPGSHGVEDFVDCVLGELGQRVPTAASEEVYRVTSLPLARELNVVPNVLEPKPRARLAANGIRYVVVISGQTTSSPNEFSIETGVVPFVAAGFWERYAHERLSQFVADLYDTASGDLVTRAHASSWGMVGVDILLVIPIPILAATESEACRVMSDALERTLASAKAERP